MSDVIYRCVNNDHGHYYHHTAHGWEVCSTADFRLAVPIPDHDMTEIEARGHRLHRWSTDGGATS